MFSGKGFGLSALCLVALLLSFVAYGCAASPTPTPAPATRAPSAPTATAPAPAATKAPAATPAAAAALAKAPAGAATKPSGSPVKVGYMTPITGIGTSWGRPQQIAVNMAVEDINAAGGINGRPLELVTFDSPTNPQQAVVGARKLMEQDKVFAVLGPYASGEVEAAAPIAKQLETPLVTASGAKPGIHLPARPWAIQFAEVDENIIPVLIDNYRKTYPNVKRIVVTGDVKESVNEFITRTLWPRFAKEKGLEIIETLPFETGATDFSAIVTKIKGLNPDGIAVAAFVTEAVGVAKELERQGVKAPVATGIQIHGTPFLTIAGSAGEGWVGMRYSTIENPDPNFQKFLSRFNDRVKAENLRIDQVAPEPVAYDVMMIFADIMRKNNITPETPLQQARVTIRDGLNNLKAYQGLIGTVNIDANGTAHWRTYPHLAKGGKWTLIK